MPKCKIRHKDVETLEWQDWADLPALSQYRKKPVVVEAVQMPGFFEVDTLEGTMQGAPNDFLIRGVQGEFYPCKPDIFSLTYEPVTQE